MKQRERSKDFDSSDLPATYPALWRDGVKQRWGTLLLFGALSFCALLPLLGIMLWEDIYAYQLTDEVRLGEISLEEATLLSFWNRNIAGSLFVVAFPVFFIVSFALMRYLRLIAFEEPLFYKEDFFSSLKATWTNGLFYGLLFAVLFWVSLFVAGSDVNPFIRYLPLLSLFVFFAPLVLYSLTLSPYYDLSFPGYLSRSLLLYLRHFPISLLFLVGFSSPFFLTLIANPFIRYPVIFVFVLFCYPLLMHGWMIYCLSIYDRDINKDDFPDFYRKGMAPMKGEENGNNQAK